nr:hypothetical protein [Ktedonobacteraceae bacterium]
VLNVLESDQHAALTQLELPTIAGTMDLRRSDISSVVESTKIQGVSEMGNVEQTLSFVRRYVIWLALGELLRDYGFEPCHAAALTAPGDNQQGMLVLGASGSGKTTTSLGCTLADCGLLGDDLVMLREDDDAGSKTIHAYTLLPEISVRTHTLDFWPELAFLRTYPVDERDKRFCAIEILRQGASRLVAPIRFLLFPVLVTDGNSKLLPLSKAAALRELTQLCISKEYGNTRPALQQRQFQLLTLLAEQGQSYRLEVTTGDRNVSQLICSLFTGVTDE